MSPARLHGLAALACGAHLPSVLHNGDQEIERELTSPADALRIALMMLARRGWLEIGDVLKVVAPS
jgi:hypothetical protein